MPLERILRPYVSLERHVFMTGSTAKYQSSSSYCFLKESKQLLEISFTFACQADNFLLVL